VKRMLVALSAATALLLGACGGASSGTSGTSSGSASGSSAASAATGPVTVTDALGRTVSFAAPPKRIVITGKALFMITDVAFMFPEADQRVVALGSGKQYKLDFAPIVDSNYSSATVLGKTAGVDQVVAAKPDAVFLKTSAQSTLGKPLEAVGIKVVYFDLETPQAYQREIGTMGKLLGDPARAQELQSYFSDQTAKVKAAASKSGTRPKVLVLYYDTKNSPVSFNVSPADWINVSEVQDAGGVPVWTSGVKLGNSWTTVSLEQIAAWNPDQVYLITYFSDPKTVVDTIKADARWKGLTAVQHNAVYAFPGDYYSWDQPDPRWILGLTWLATKVHPETASALDVDATSRTFYQKLYGLDSTSYDQKVKPNLWGDLP